MKNVHVLQMRTHQFVTAGMIFPAARQDLNQLQTKVQHTQARRLGSRIFPAPRHSEKESQQAPKGEAKQTKTEPIPLEELERQSKTLLDCSAVSPHRRKPD
ncbi:hypothetical protein PTTG_12020 [Puccinia triticina 1-1 BBBD Race 1]|uniref:Uncharacterized protein n=1 Tax=Puccinia triticina (isolate 1-1 / race 1 (BBBD)) TaxID=630390 RepID=A0A180GUD4_PUCT1|nr:hypothetical protein PTTG_12020 [Puccinia triticina 1-1 BBBD Race 1]